MEELQVEINRLQYELDKSSNDKTLAAEYGLAVLQEKQVLQQEFDDMQVTHNETTLDLIATKNALVNIENNSKQASVLGIRSEDELLKETSSRIDELNGNIDFLNNEVKTYEKRCDQATSDYDKMNSAYKDLSIQRKQLRHDYKEAKIKETRNLSDLNELEDENVMLQKQNQMLRQSQVEAESTLYENIQLKEQQDEGISEIAEISKLKSMIETQLEDALLALSSEREQKMNMKRDLDQQIAANSNYALKNLASLNLADTYMDGGGDKSIGSLFSEVHNEEIDKFEKRIASLEKLREELEMNLASAQSARDSQAQQIEKLKKTEQLLNEMTITNESDLQKRSDIDNDALRIANEKVENATFELCATSDALLSLGGDIAQVYHLLCEVTGDTPSRVVLEHVAPPAAAVGEKREDRLHRRSSRSASRESNDSCSKGATTCEVALDTIKDQVKYLRKAAERTSNLPRQNTLSTSDSDATLSEQHFDTDSDALSKEKYEKAYNELKHDNVRLVATISTKREQIVTLRRVLRANKNTAEEALGNLLVEDSVTFVSLRALFAQRCDEYKTQLESVRQQLSSSDEEKKTLNSLLKMAIGQKLKLTQRLEDLEMDHEIIQQHRVSSSGGSRNTRPKVRGQGFGGAGATRSRGWSNTCNRSQGRSMTRDFGEKGDL